MVRPPGSWAIRRTFMFVVCAFSASMIAWAMAGACNDSKVAETVVTMAFTCIISCVGSYVFGAVWDHQNARRDG